MYCNFFDNFRETNEQKRWILFQKNLLCSCSFLCSTSFLKLVKHVCIISEKFFYKIQSYFGYYAILERIFNYFFSLSLPITFPLSFFFSLSTFNFRNLSYFRACFIIWNSPKLSEIFLFPIRSISRNCYSAEIFPGNILFSSLYYE